MRSIERALFVGVLAWAAGAVDALGFLLLDGVFTSHVTGNTTAVILALIAGKGSHPGERLLVLGGFAAGALGGALLVECHRKHSAAGALLLESALLVATAALLWNHPASTLVTDSGLLIVACAMGIQNIALAGSALSAHTTHITGPFTDLAGTVARRLVGRRRLARDESHGLLVYGGRVVSFTIGVASGAALFLRVGTAALLAPAIAVALCGVVLWSGDRGWSLEAGGARREARPLTDVSGRAG
jgi:uncharacterized membrane protein YoaK (UPF0700 family)